MTINYNKTSYMIISNRDTTLVHDVHINERTIKPTDSYKFLGVTIDKNLKFDVHIANISLKISKSIGIIIIIIIINFI